MTKSIDKIKKFSKSVLSDQTQREVVFMGKEDGTILTDTLNMVWVRFENQLPFQVYNTIAPVDVPDLQVIIGKHKYRPTLWEIISIRNGFQQPAAVNSNQTVYNRYSPVNRDQITLLITLPTAIFPVVQLYGGVVIFKGVWVAVLNDLIDLTDYLPSTGALYVLLQSDDTGTLSIVEGTPADSKEVLLLSDIPVTDDDHFAVCAIRLYVGQTQLFRPTVDYPGDFVYPWQITSTKQTFYSDDPLDVTNGDPSPGISPYVSHGDHQHHYSFFSPLIDPETQELVLDPEANYNVIMVTEE